MKLLFIAVTLTAVVAAKEDRNLTAESNVNRRYTVESVELRPVELNRLSQPLRERITALIGLHFDPGVFDEVMGRIRRELRNWAVSMRLDRGTVPERIKVIFEAKKERQEVELTVPRLTYHSKENFSFVSDIGWRDGGNNLRFGIVSNNDDLVERYSGARGSYERTALAGGRLRLGVELEAWRSQWNPAVEKGLAENAGVPGVYRTRVNVQPSATMTLIRPLTLQLGVSVERVETQYPLARHELSSAAFMTLRFQRRWEPMPDRHGQLEATYGLRSGTGLLASDFIFSRHLWRAHYDLRGNRDEITISAQAGLIEGRAPLFERFILGNSTTLRGWSKYDIAPFGADRMAHFSAGYRYRWARVVYDTGAAWNAGASSKLRHSVGVGVTTNGSPSISAMVAFPLRGDGAITPIFITGLNF
ncbi:MAG: BamA/TamA family outer membrane protein [Bryobacteraceae bacterium]